MFLRKKSGRWTGAENGGRTQPRKSSSFYTKNDEIKYQRKPTTDFRTWIFQYRKKRYFLLLKFWVNIHYGKSQTFSFTRSWKMQKLMIFQFFLSALVNRFKMKKKPLTFPLLFLLWLKNDTHPCPTSGWKWRDFGKRLIIYLCLIYHLQTDRQMST